ncbi:MAG: hypothetical protein EAZ97_13050 [Bacteroidetes bacterium]|nr:MAG: hypothetical protein EAZ97_13050 [Bacteroidota bacterium]
MNGIKKYLLNFRNKHFLKRIDLLRKTLNYQDVKSVGVIFLTHDEQMHEHLNNFVKKMKDDKKNVTAITYFDRLHDNPYLFRYDFFTEKDISLFGEVKCRETEQFINTEFDYLYCISTEAEIDVFEPILAKCKAKCRIGNYRESKETLFELMIHIKQEQNIDILIQEMLRYTQAIRFN